MSRFATRAGASGTVDAAVWARRIFGAALTVALLGVAAWRADLRGASALLGEAGPSLLLVPLPFLVALALDARVVQQVLRHAGQRRSLVSMFSVRCSIEALHLALPGGAVVSDAVSPALLVARARASMDAAIAALAVRKTLLCRAHALYLLVCCAALALAPMAKDQARLSSLMAWLLPLSATLPMAMSLAIALGLFGHRGQRLMRAIFDRLPASLRARVQGVGRDITPALEHASPFVWARASVVPTVAFLAGWLLESCETWLLLRLLDVSLPWSTVLAVEGSLSVLRSMAVLTPAGLGLLELGYAGLFVAFGIPHADAVAPAFMMLRRGRELLVVMLGFLAFVPAHSPSRRRKMTSFRMGYAKPMNTTNVPAKLTISGGMTPACGTNTR